MESSLKQVTDRYYRGSGGHQYHDQKRALRPEVVEWVLHLRAAKFQPLVNEEHTVVEFGVGSGWNLGRLQCRRKIGIDRADFLSEKLAQLGIEFFPEAEQLPAAIADVLICHQTLEHVISPAETLLQFCRILIPGGKLILHVPWERERRYARFDSDEPNHHLFNWNAQNLGNLLEVLGFKIQEIRVRRYGYDRFAANLAFRLHLGEAGFRLLRAAMIRLRPFREIEAVAISPGSALP